MKKPIDVIIIGSGIGSLTTASILAQLYHKRILILERHFKLGGFTHTFRRKGKYEWDVGVHYIGEMYEGQLLRTLFDFVTRGSVKWKRMPEEYDVFMYPEHTTFKARAGKTQLKDTLIREFPHERQAIENYFQDISRAVWWFYRLFVAIATPNWLNFLSEALSSPRSRLALSTVKEYLDERFHNDTLKAVLASQWGTLGLPPSRSAFAVHAVIVNHYLEGAYYPVGGARTITDSIIPLVKEQGGGYLLGYTAKEILLEDNVVKGVKAVVESGRDLVERTFYAKYVVSGIGLEATYDNLLPDGVDCPFRLTDEDGYDGVSCVTLFLGLKHSPRSLGIEGENYWIYDSYDHDDVFSRRNELAKGKVSHCYLSFPSLKNPEASTHTAEIIAFMDYGPFEKWDNEPWKHRSQDYEMLKERITNALLQFVNRHHPGFSELVDYAELATPLSTTSMLGHKNGRIYGIPVTPNRYKNKWVGPQTPVKNLYLTGVDSLVHGVAGGMLGGILAAGAITGGPITLLRMLVNARRMSKNGQ